MRDLKLKIELLPKGAWNNDFSKTLSQKDWDKIRNYVYKKANYKCEICGFQTTELDAHEVWEFDVKNKTQTLKNILALCSKCHGVKHFKNSARLGYFEESKQHFINVNNCSEIEFASHLSEALLNYEEQNKIFRWKINADLGKFGGTDIQIKNDYIPFIKSPYDEIDWHKTKYEEIKKLFKVEKKEGWLGAPKIIDIVVDNYEGKIFIDTIFCDRIEWFLDNIKIKTKYNVAGRFQTEFSVKNLTVKFLHFKLSNENGYLISKPYELSSIQKSV